MGPCTYIPVVRGKCRVRASRIPRKWRTSVVCVHSRLAVHLYPRRARKMPRPGPADPAKTPRVGHMRAQPARRAPISPSCAENAAFGPPESREKCARRSYACAAAGRAPIFPTCGKKATFGTLGPREKGARRSYACMGWCSCTYIPDVRPFLGRARRPAHPTACVPSPCASHGLRPAQVAGQPMACNPYSYRPRVCVADCLAWNHRDDHHERDEHGHDCRGDVFSIGCGYDFTLQLVEFAHCLDGIFHLGILFGP